jgi:hypothetical protein
VTFYFLNLPFFLEAVMPTLAIKEDFRLSNPLKQCFKKQKVRTPTPLKWHLLYDWLPPYHCQTKPEKRMYEYFYLICDHPASGGW